MGKLKVAVIGCGGIANQKHFPALKNNADLNEIVAFCDIKIERAQAAAKEFGTPDAQVTADYREVLANPEVEIVHICTPNVSHSEIAIAAFAAKKHVYCEKPMSHSTEEAEKMVEAWKKSGMQFTVGYQNRFRPEVQNLHAACQKGDLGDIYYAKAHAVRRRGVPTWGVFMDKEAQGGGPLIDIGTHALDITLWCMDNYDIDSVTGSVFYKLGGLEQATEGNLFGPWDPKTYEVEDSAMGFVKMKNGATIALEASWALNILESREASTTLCGTAAGAEIHSGMSYTKNELIYNRGRNGQLMEETISPVGGVAYFGGGGGEEGTIDNRQWLEAVKNGTEPLVKPEQALAVTKVLDAIYKSARENKDKTDPAENFHSFLPDFCINIILECSNGWGKNKMEDHLKKKKLRVEVLNVTEEREHFHQEIELLFVLEGSLDVTTGSNVTHMEAEDFLVKYELKPHIELGMKPKRLQKNVQDVLLLEGTEDKFPDKNRWREILTAMIKHMIHRYGRAEVSSWRIELWFKESLEWNKTNIENYYKLFDDTCEIIHKYCDKVQIGGCGFLLDRIGHMEEEEFLSKWKNQKHFPDFLTFLYYGYERDSILQDGYSKRLTDSEGMLHRVSYIRKLIKKIISEDYPIYITEWNLTISDRNYMNDTCFKGAYIVKNVLDCYGLCFAMALFQASDRTSEYYDSNEMLHGGTGIITKDMILKPAGFAFEFLNRLLPYYIGKNSNCLLTTDGHGNYGIICHNQKKLNYNYYLLPEDQVDKKNIWKYFEDRDSREIKIRLTDVEDGIYQMKTYSINEQNGSVLDIWGELGYESELTRNDIKYFRRVCEPKLKIQKVEAKGGNLDINMTLAANEIAFIRLKWFA